MPAKFKLADDGLGDAYRRLAAAMLLQAVKDATGEGHGADPADCEAARQWLHSVEARDLAAALDLENSLRRWLCKKSQQRSTGLQESPRIAKPFQGKEC